MRKVKCDQSGCVLTPKKSRIILLNTYAEENKVKKSKKQFNKKLTEVKKPSKVTNSKRKLYKEEKF